jgi:chromosome segregation ATPase
VILSGVAGFFSSRLALSEKLVSVTFNNLNERITHLEDENNDLRDKLEKLWAKLEGMKEREMQVLKMVQDLGGSIEMGGDSGSGI